MVNIVLIRTVIKQQRAIKMGFIVEEFHLACLILTRKYWVLIIPLMFCLACFLLKINLLQPVEANITPNQIDVLGPIVEIVREKSLRKMDKIALFGTIGIFIACYLKARRQLRWF